MKGLGIKQSEQNISTLMLNQNLLNSSSEQNLKANNISQIYLVKNRHLINGLVDALKCSKNTIYYNNL